MSRAEYETRLYKKARQKELCDLLDEVSWALYYAYEAKAGVGYEDLHIKVEEEIHRLKCKRKK